MGRVAEVRKSVLWAVDLDELMSETARLIHDRYRYPQIQLFTVHPNRWLIEYEAGNGRDSQELEGYTLPLDDPGGIVPWVARGGKTVLANDISKDPRYRPSRKPPKNVRSELCVPLVFNERVVGVLDIQSDKPNAFKDDDQSMFETVAGTIAAGIRNADLYRSELWRRQVTDSLREVAGLLSDYVGVDEALEAILIELERNLPVDISAIWLLEDGELDLAAVHGSSTEALEKASLSRPEVSANLKSILLAVEPVIRKPSDLNWPLGLADGFE